MIQIQLRKINYLWKSMNLKFMKNIIGKIIN